MEHNQNAAQEHANCHGHGKWHGILMLLCCALMILGVFFLPRFGGPLAFLPILLCPLMHIFMIGAIFKKKK